MSYYIQVYGGGCAGAWQTENILGAEYATKEDAERALEALRQEEPDFADDFRVAEVEEE